MGLLEAKHLKGDFADTLGFESNRRAMTEFKTLRVMLDLPS